MKKKQVLAVSSALMIGTTTALTGLPTPVMAQENTEVVQEAVVEENKTEQVPVEQKTENAEVQENITDKEQEETAENAETLKEESTKQETPATPEKEVVTEDKTVEASKNTEVKAGSIAIDEAHFPDKVFREQIIAEFDKDGDSVLSVDEISKAQLVISDAHKGLVSAIRKSFTNVSWQRCQVHFLRNIFTTIPKKNSKSFREAVKGIFKFTDINLAREAKNRLIHDYIDQPKYSKACASLDDGFEDAFQYTVQGNSHNRLKSTNLIERLNQEVRRREKIIRIFPNQTSANRLIGAVLMDLHDEWIYSSRKYINFDK